MTRWLNNIIRLEKKGGKLTHLTAGGKECHCCLLGMLLVRLLHAVRGTYRLNPVLKAGTREYGSLLSIPSPKSKGIKSSHFYLPSTSMSSPSSKAFIWSMIGNVQFSSILSIALFPVLGYIQEKKNHQVLAE